MPEETKPKPVQAPATTTLAPKKEAPQQTEYVRVRLPRKDRDEVLGIIEEHFGSKLLIRCLDGHTRVCRIPVKIRYKLRVRAGDVVLVKKWIVQSDEKGDYLYYYRRNQIAQLIKKGLLKQEDLA